MEDSGLRFSWFHGSALRAHGQYWRMDEVGGHPVVGCEAVPHTVVSITFMSNLHELSELIHPESLDSFPPASGERPLPDLGPEV